MKKLTVKELYWYNHVATCLQSGMQQLDYCKKHDLNPKSFSVRKSEYFRRQKKMTEDTHNFIPLESSPSTVTIKLSTGEEIKFDKMPDPSWVGSVLKELSSHAQD